MTKRERRTKRVTRAATPPTAERVSRLRRVLDAVRGASYGEQGAILRAALELVGADRLDSTSGRPS